MEKSRKKLGSNSPRSALVKAGLDVTQMESPSKRFCSSSCHVKDQDALVIDDQVVGFDHNLSARLLRPLVSRTRRLNQLTQVAPGLTACH